MHCEGVNKIMTVEALGKSLLISILLMGEKESGSQTGQPRPNHSANEYLMMLLLLVCSFSFSFSLSYELMMLSNFRINMKERPYRLAESNKQGQQVT